MMNILPTRFSDLPPSNELYFIYLHTFRVHFVNIFISWKFHYGRLKMMGLGTMENLDCHPSNSRCVPQMLHLTFDLSNVVVVGCLLLMLVVCC